MKKVPFMIDGKNIETIAEEAVASTIPSIVKGKNMTGDIKKEQGAPLGSSKATTPEEPRTCYFKARPVSIVKLVETGRPIDPWGILIRGRLTIHFPGIIIGEKILVPKDSVPASKQWFLKRLSPFSAYEIHEGFEILSGVVSKVLPYHLDERAGGSKGEHLSVWTKSGSLYLVSILSL